MLCFQSRKGWKRITCCCELWTCSFWSGGWQKTFFPDKVLGSLCKIIQKGWVPSLHVLITLSNHLMSIMSLRILFMVTTWHWLDKMKMVSNKKFEWLGNWLAPTLGCSGGLVVMKVTGSEDIVRGSTERNNRSFDETYVPNAITHLGHWLVMPWWSKRGETRYRI